MLPTYNKVSTIRLLQRVRAAKPYWTPKQLTNYTYVTQYSLLFFNYYLLPILFKVKTKQAHTATGTDETVLILTVNNSVITGSLLLFNIITSAKVSDIDNAIYMYN